METSLTTHTTVTTWQMSLTSSALGAALVVLLLYLIYRHVMLILVAMDLIVGWLRQFRWFPGPGKRLNALLHWIFAVVAVAVFITVTTSAGWLVFVWN